jgi:hypothetical protein
MSNPIETQSTGHDRAISREDMMSALFAHMVTQQANLAMMLMGKVVHPETGKAVRDLEAAQLFIDQLEMLQQKTKGNLTKNEEALLKQSLMNLRLAFVEAVDSPAPAEQPAPAAPQPAPEPSTQPEPESHKKFSKKY